MMGREHARSGLAAGFWVAPYIGAGDPVTATLVAVTVAGMALLPDLDHRGATASRRLGWFTGAVSWALRHSSMWLYRHTKGRADEPVKGDHRHASHMVLFGALAGGITAAAGALSPWTILLVIVFAVLCAEAVLGDWVPLAALGLGLAFVIPAMANGALDLDRVLERVGDLSWTVGIAVAVGVVVHCLGDALTHGGCPLLFPLPIKGETWYEIHLMGAFHFSAGGPVERWAARPALILSCLIEASPILLPVLHLPPALHAQITVVTSWAAAVLYGGFAVIAATGWLVLLIRGGQKPRRRTSARRTRTRA